MPQKALPLIIGLKHWREQNGLSQSEPPSIVSAGIGVAVLVRQRSAKYVRMARNDASSLASKTSAAE
jgi:hypothetical protein